MFGPRLSFFYEFGLFDEDSKKTRIYIVRCDGAQGQDTVFRSLFFIHQRDKGWEISRMVRVQRQLCVKNLDWEDLLIHREEEERDLPEWEIWEVDRSIRLLRRNCLFVGLHEEGSLQRVPNYWNQDAEMVSRQRKTKTYWRRGKDEMCGSVSPSQSP